MQIEDFFKCPISQARFTDPIQLNICGHTFDRVSLTKHMENIFSMRICGSGKFQCPNATCTSETFIEKSERYGGTVADRVNRLVSRISTPNVSIRSMMASLYGVKLDEDIEIVSVSPASKAKTSKAVTVTNDNGIVKMELTVAPTLRNEPIVLDPPDVRRVSVPIPIARNTSTSVPIPISRNTSTSLDSIEVDIMTKRIKMNRHKHDKTNDSSKAVKAIQKSKPVSMKRTSVGPPLRPQAVTIMTVEAIQPKKRITRPVSDVNRLNCILKSMKKTREMATPSYVYL